MLLAAITALLTGATPLAEGRDTVRAPGCDAVAASVSRAPWAPDLAAALTLRGGVARWDTGERPLAVWVQPRARRVGASFYLEAEWRTAVVDGVLGWTGAVPGVRFAVGRDSATADVRVVWARSLPTATAGDPSAGARAEFTAGRTILVADPAGRLTDATIVVAASTPDGVAYRPSDVRAVVQHEIGHALGLAHHASPRSVMAPVVSTDRLAPEDRAVLRALYGLAPGTVCRAQP